MKSSVVHFLQDFSVLLRIKREKLNFSQLELATKLGISLRTYQRIECGESEPSLSQVYKLAYILNFDVSEIFRSEKKASEETKLLDQSYGGFGCWNLNLKTNKLYQSPSLYELFEIQNENDDIISHERFLNAIHPDDKERVDSMYKKSLTTQGSYEDEHRIILPNGGIRWVLVKYKTEFDSQGLPSQSYGFTLDVSKYRK